MQNPNVLNQDQLMALMGYARPGDVERKLLEQGVQPIYGRAGYFFITLAMLRSEQEESSIDLI